ncbi:type II secretion system protein [Patescibacteria group bacterium]
MPDLKKEKGFTLVELLVVLAIVGILIGLAIGGIRIVQEVNRDTQRKALVRDIQLALESYQEKNNEYPSSGSNDLTLTKNPSGCDGMYIEAGGTESVCSKATFSPQWDSADCTGYPKNIKEAESGDFSGCYEGNTRSYDLYVLLERTGKDYNAGN